MNAVKISNTLSGIENNGTIRILTTLTKESFEVLKGKPFPDACINEAIEFYDKKKEIEEKLNQMQDEINSLKRGGQFSSYQPQTTKENENAEVRNSEVEVTNIVNVKKNAISKSAQNDENENRDLLLGMLDALEEEGFD